MVEYRAFYGDTEFHTLVLQPQDIKDLMEKDAVIKTKAGDQPLALFFFDGTRDEILSKLQEVGHGEK